MYHLLLIFLLGLAGCVSQTVKPAFPSSVAVGGPPYQIYLPSVVGKDPAVKRPLVVVLHGCLQTAETMGQLTRMNEEAERAGFLVLYPDQARGRHSMNCWQWFLPENRKRGGEELSMIMGMIEDVKKSQPVDPSRIYVTGLSSGAATSAALLACYPSDFAGGALLASPGLGIASNEKDAQLAMGQVPSRKKLSKESCSGTDFKGRVLILAGSRDRTVNPQQSALLAEQFSTDAERKVKVLSTFPLVHAGEMPYVMACFGKPARVCRVSVEGLEHAWSGGQLFPFSEPRGPSASEMIRRFLVEGEAPGKVAGTSSPRPAVKKD
jgi:poly(hydroxyalkanoate) depolymerase family esterase